MEKTIKENIAQDNMPTPSQRECLKRVKSFLEGDNNVFILKGSAGTGKTSLIKPIINLIADQTYGFHAAAPTGRAAQVLNNKGIENVKTIHRLIYKKDVESYDEDDDGIVFHFELRQYLEETPMIFIIDEASMVSDVYSNTDILKFGTGYLLRDLLSYAANDKRNKVIFIGDENQLPPIKMNNSPALDEEYLANLTFNLKSESFELTEIVRQQSDSPIISMASKIKRNIKERDFRKIEFDSAEDIKLQDQENLQKSYIGSTKDQLDDSILISFTNKKVTSYNKLFREKLFDNPEEINIDDRLIVTANNYHHNLLNGEMIKVKDVTSGRITVPIKLSGNKARTILHFKEITVECYDENFNPIDKNLLILENLLESEVPTITKDERRALLAYFNQRHKELKKGSDEYLNAFLVDPYINALHVKYGYAVTCHKAQGGEWQNVFFDFEAQHMNPNTKDYFRFVYTAITRTKKRLFLINAPQNSILKLKSNNNQLEAIAQPLPNNFTEAIANIERIFNTKFKITELNYRLRINFTFNGTEQEIDLTFNGKNIITHVKLDKLNDINEELLQSIKELKGIYIDNESSTEQVVEIPGNPKLQDIYYEISTRVSPSNIEINKIEHLNYLERYTFSKNEGKAVVNFIYDRNFFITTVLPHRNIENKLFHEIKGLINGN